MKLMLRLLWADLKCACAIKLAYALPRSVAYWAAIRVMAHAASVVPLKEMDGLSPADCLRLWKDEQ